MELGGGGGAAAGPGPGALGGGGLDVLQQSVGSLLSSYGWYLLLAGVAIYLLVQKLSQSLAGRSSSQQRAAGADEEPEAVVRRQEALAAARLRMQEELNAQAERYKEKQRQLEEEKRRQKIAMWESMQEGKSYKGNLKLNQAITHCLEKEVALVPGGQAGGARRQVAEVNEPSVAWH